MQALDRTLLLVGGLAILALLTGSPVLAGTAAGLLVMAALLVLLPSVGGIEAERELDSVRVIEGAEANDHVRVRGTLRLPTVITARDKLPGIAEAKETGAVTHVGVGPFELDLRAKVDLPVRGAAHFGPLELDLLDPLGLTNHAVDALGADTVLVWPRTEMAREQPMISKYQRVLAGRHLVRNPGASLEFFGLREYAPADPMRAVNWKATAKSGDLLVNQFEKETHGEITLFLDIRRITQVGTHRENALNDLIRAAATIAYIVSRERDLLRAYAFGPDRIIKFKVDPGRNWYEQFMDWLATLQAEGDNDITYVFDEVLPHMTPKSMMVFLSPLYGDQPLKDAPTRALALGNQVLGVVPGVPGSLPPRLAERLEEARVEQLRHVEAMGVEVFDIGRSGSILQSIMERRVAR